MRVLLTGAAGRLGRHAVALLRDTAHDVVGVDSKADGSDPNVRRLDLLDSAAVSEAAAGCDAVVHLGNYASHFVRPPAQLFSENVTMNANVFQAARERGVRVIVFASTVQVTASELSASECERDAQLAYLPMDGDLPADPTNMYALSKRVGEIMLAQWATQMALSAVSLRFPMLLPLDKPQYIPWPKRDAAGNMLPPKPALVAQGFSWLSMRDAARLIEMVLRRPLPGARTYFPAAPTPLRPLPVAELLALHYRDVPRRPGHSGPMTSLVDNSAVERDTGWTPLDTDLPPEPEPT